MEYDVLRLFFQEAWCKETCYTPWKDKYGKDNRLPSYGQCVVTSLFVYYLLGGKIIRDSKTNHYWNIIDNNDLDLTRDQFDSSIVFNGDKLVTAKSLLSNWDTFQRFRYLLNRIYALNLCAKYGIQMPEWATKEPKIDKSLNWYKH